MTLKRRLTTQIGMMMLGVLMLGAIAVVGVISSHQDFGLALRANEQTRQIAAVGVHVASAQSFLEHNPVMPGSASMELKLALGYFDSFDRSPGFDWIGGTQPSAAKLRTAIENAISNLDHEATPDTSALADAYTNLADFSAVTQQVIKDMQIAADKKHRQVLIAVIALSGMVAALAAYIGRRQYQGVMAPLKQMQETVRRIAAGQLTDRLTVDGDAEFAALATDFNHMASELQSLYEDLERRIDAKSRELVRCERLASVGYLAAGVAHEINNPLGIIAGYGERSLQRLDRNDGTDRLDYVRKAIMVICDESFRCKQITDRLLLLARSGDNAKQKFSFHNIVHEVVISMGAMPRFADRRITFESSTYEELYVMGNEGELRQVILNLVVNALEASDPGSGQVHVSVTRQGSEIVFSVQDNGHGMTAETIGRVFEPFFTQKRGERPGTGLGLSVAHAIVIDHKGRIDASSDGAGKGSCFNVRLPAAALEMSHAQV